jgi:dCTP deaminase
VIQPANFDHFWCRTQGLLVPIAQPQLTGLQVDAVRSEHRSLPVSEKRSKSGLLPRQRIRAMLDHKMILATTDIDETQLQPASLDLRLGSRAYRIRASFLPGPDKKISDQLAELRYDEIKLDDGAVFERGCVYLVELQEHLKLPESIAAIANPKSSTGRLDVFTRLISNSSEVFDSVRAGYEGPLFAEISPRSFSIKVRKGSRLNQIRFRRLNSQHEEHSVFHVDDRVLRERHEQRPLMDGDLTLRNGLVLRVGLSNACATTEGIIGYRAQKFTDSIDVDNTSTYDVADYWEPILSRSDNRLILDPHQFYILASAERLHIPPDLAAEMVPIDPTMGEFRVHYAGFFDPGFGYTEHGHPGSRAVLEVRSHEVPFILEDRQIIGRLVFERLSEVPDVLYGQTPSSSYQGQGLKLSKHFRG